MAPISSANQMSCALGEPARPDPSPPLNPACRRDSSRPACAYSHFPDGAASALGSPLGVLAAALSTPRGTPRGAPQLPRSVGAGPQGAWGAQAPQLTWTLAPSVASLKARASSHASPLELGAAGLGLHRVRTSISAPHLTHASIRAFPYRAWTRSRHVTLAAAILAGGLGGEWPPKRSRGFGGRMAPQRNRGGDPDLSIPRAVEANPLRDRVPPQLHAGISAGL